MRLILIGAALMSNFLNAQILVEYRDSGNIRTIETVTQEGKFSKSGKLIRSDHNNSVGGPFESVVRFDEHGNIEYKEQLWPFNTVNGQPIEFQKYSNEYYYHEDCLDSILQTTGFVPSGQERNKKIVYKYSPDSLIIWQNHFDENGKQIGSAETLMDSANHTVSERVFREDSTLEFQTEIEYDVYGRITRSIFFVPNRYSITTITVYEDSLIHNYVINDQDTSYSRSTYNKRGLKIQHENESQVFYYTYDYDQYGNWIVMRVYDSRRKLIGLCERKISYRD